MYRSGLGRIGYLKEKIKISQVVEKMKSHLKMKTFRLALANGKTQGKMEFERKSKLYLQKYFFIVLFSFKLKKMTT